MVYVHGGSFYQSDASQFPPNYLLERNVILVVVQYRLDALGFLSTNTDDIPGNAGLMDVQLALTFVKQNIARFGGDPKRVTLFGQSAGAAIVSALTISPAVPKNLFHRVIIQSGSIFSKWSVTTDPVKDAKDIAEAAGLNSQQSIDVLNRAFMRMDVFDLLSAVDRYQVYAVQVTSKFFLIFSIVKYVEKSTSWTIKTWSSIDFGRRSDEITSQFTAGNRLFNSVRQVDSDDCWNDKRRWIVCINRFVVVHCRKRNTFASIILVTGFSFGFYSKACFNLILVFQQLSTIFC